MSAPAPPRPRTGGILLAQRTLFAGPSTSAPDHLYSRALTGAVLRERDRVTLEAHTRLTTNTFFGRFPADHWQRRTEISSVEITAQIHGTGRISVAADDSEGHPRTVATTVAAGPEEQTVRLHADIDRFADGGALWLDVETDDERVTVENVRWLVQTPRPSRATDLVICTHNRPERCVDVLVELVRDTELLDRLGAVHVVDQGDDLVLDAHRFGFVRRVLGTKLHYLRQPNLGVAGGIARGLREITPGPVNAVLVDDDVRLEPETVSRLASFAACTADPVLLGAQALDELHPDRLDESPRRWRGLVPAEAVARAGYPLPLFCEHDDAEFTARVRAAGMDAITLPGAGIWQGDSDWHDDDWTSYFRARNDLVTAALRDELRPRGRARRLLAELVEDLLAMRYGQAATRIKAVEDFLRGPEVLADGGAESFAEIGKLRAEFPETQCVPAFEVAPGVERREPGRAPRLPRLTMLARLAGQLCNRPKATAAVPAADAHWWHVSRFRAAVVTDASQRGVRMRRFDREMLLRLARRGAVQLWRFLRHGGRTARRYRDAADGLGSAANWDRLFSRPR
ncbi:glycosyl transferase [Saccharopolyspora taberi]|uniref:Glycosyltransferase n=1 Tax=Saccharopolyspora taberi TaxID=60895 RepID=A0ABN3VLV2_9PSEU